MASRSSSSSSSKHNQPVWKTSGTWNMKKNPTINDYINSYVAANLLRPKLNKPPLVFCQQTSDSETPSQRKSENRHRSRSKNKSEADKINELAKEMDKMLSKAKSKRQTNDLLQLFKNTLNNFIVPEHPMDGNNSIEKLHPQEKQISLPSTAPIYHQRHSYQRRLDDMNESRSSDQNLFSDHETSMTVTTTTTRCEIKDPSRNVIEASKTNILHRCYGKQSVKALPQMYKSRKKNNTNRLPNCQKPPVLKSKSQKSPKQQQTKTPSQQMKTIYENEQFVKSDKLITENSDDTDGIAIDNSTSVSSTDTDKLSAIEMQPHSEMNRLDKDMKISKDFLITESTDTRKQNFKVKSIKIKSDKEINCSTNKGIKQTTMDVDMSIEQDNSLVQRLTSFWNKKLNTLGTTKSMTDQSTATSSLTSIYEEDAQKDNDMKKYKSSTQSKSEENVNEYNKKNKVELPYDAGDSEFIDHNKELKENMPTNNNNYEEPTAKSKEKHNIIQNDSDLPNLQMGLMDELIRVLQNRDDTGAKSKKKRSSDDKTSTLHINNDCKENNINSKSQPNCMTSTGSQILVTVNDTGDELSDCEEDDYDYIEHCDEKTLEAIEKCLLEDMSYESVGKDVGDSSKEQSKIITEECFLKNSVVRELNTYNDCENLKDNEAFNIYRNDKFQSEDDLTNFSNRNAVITNVNSIITNLKKLIHTIESIPDELKSVDMNLSSLPIPDKIKRKISSLIVTPDNDSNCDKRLCLINSTNRLDHLRMLDMPSEQNQLFQSSCSGKLLGYTKKEGYMFTLYFPKQLTMPLVEHVKKPFHMILFPKRNECLRLVKSRSLNDINGSNSGSTREITVLNSEDVNDDKKDEDEEEEIKENKINTKENLQSTSEIIKQNIERIDKAITEITKLETRTTQSSVLCVSSSPSSTTPALKTCYKSSDNIHAGPKQTILFKRNKITTTVFPSENLPNDLINVNKSTVKFEENIYSENNGVSNKNSFEELSDRTSGVSCVSNNNQHEEFNVITVHNISNAVENNDNNDCFPGENDTFHKESRVNLDDSRPPSPNDLSTVNRRYNNMRRRRCRLQNHIEEDTGLIVGGSGDSMQNCGDGLPSIPCHHTSSMSVIVSSSVNDSNSQPDINIVESESNLSKLRIIGHCGMIGRPQPPQDSDNFSTCGVIQEEGSDEQLSDIDDCVMIEQHNNKKEIKKDSYDTVSSSTISSQNMTLSNNLEQDVTTVISQDNGEECESNNEKQAIDGCSHDQFEYQNLKNILNEETDSLLSQNLSNCNTEENLTLSRDDDIECKNSDKKVSDENCSEKEFLYQNVSVETATEENDEHIASQPELIQQTSFESEDIYPVHKNYSNTSLSQENVDYNDSNNSDNNSSSNDISDNYDDNNDYVMRSDKNNFQQNYHATYFETEISMEAEGAIANKMMCKNQPDLECLFATYPFLKEKLSKMIDIDNLSNKEKWLVAACINSLTNDYHSKQPPQLFDIAINDLTLKLCLNKLWDKTSQTMSSQIKLAKKTLIPYESDTMLYKRCYRKLRKAFYTLFISLILIFVIQKNVFGILLPVCFPW